MLIDKLQIQGQTWYVYADTTDFAPQPRGTRRTKITAEESTEKAKGIPDRPVDAGSALIYGVPGRIIRERTRGG